MLDKKFVIIDCQAKIVPAALIQYIYPIIKVHREPWYCDLVQGNIDGVSDTPDQAFS